MTEKKTLLMNDLEKKSLESPKLSLKEKTISKLKTFWKKIADSFKKVSWKDNPEWLQYMEERLEEIWWLYC